MASRKNTKKKPDAAPVVSVDGADYLVQALKANPQGYRELRIMQVERTVVENGRTKNIRRGELGAHPVQSLLNPGLYALLATHYGGAPGEGVPFHCCLIRPDGTMGPQQTVYSTRDDRPPELKAQQAHQAVNPWASGAAPPPPYGAGGPAPWNPYAAAAPGAYPPWAMPPWALPPTTKEDSLTERLLLMMMERMLAQQESAADAKSKGIQAGLDLAEELSRAREGRTAGSEAAEVVNAVSAGVSEITDTIIRAKAGAPGGKNVQVLESEEDLSNVGFFMHQAMTQGWKVERVHPVIVPLIGKERVEHFMQKPDASIPYFVSVVNAYEPLKEIDPNEIEAWVKRVMASIPVQESE